MLPLAAERGGNPDDPNKRDPLDFVLWQPSADDEPAWDSLWGPGRPGLAHRVLGPRPAGAGHHHRPARRRRRPDLPPPRVRGGPVRGGHRRALRPPLDAPGHGPDGRREDVEVAGQPRLRQRPAARPGTPGPSASPSWPTTTGTPGAGTTGSCPRPPSASSAWQAAGEGDAALDEVRAAPRRRPRHARRAWPPSTPPPPRRRRRAASSCSAGRPRCGRRPRPNGSSMLRSRADGSGLRRALPGRPGRAHAASSRPNWRVHTERPRARPRRRRGDHLPQPRLGPRLVLRPPRPAPAHHLRGQGRVHGRLEDQVHLPGHGHDPDRPVRRRRGARRRSTPPPGSSSRASCSASTPRAPAPATASSTRATPAPPAWPCAPAPRSCPVGLIGTREVQPPDAKLPQPFRPVWVKIGRPVHPGTRPRAHGRPPPACARSPTR